MTKSTDRNRFVRAWEILLGRDNETPEEERLRHVREEHMRFLLVPAVIGTLISVIIPLTVEVPIQEVVSNFFTTVIVEVLVFVCINYIYKFAQTYEIRKKEDPKK